jgi:hypothetical protein
MLGKSFLSITLAAALLLGSARAFAADKPTETSKKKEDTDGLRVGPVVGLGFPRPFSIEGLVKVDRVVSLGLEYSFLPKNTISYVTTRFDAVAVDANWHPFKGGFFLGARAGRQWLSGSATIQVQNLGSFTETADAATWFFNPRIGYLYTWSSGFTLGFDAGVQLPISATYERHGPATSAGLAQGTGVDTTLRQVAKTFGNDATPTVDLFRVGFLF